MLTFQSIAEILTVTETAATDKQDCQRPLKNNKAAHILDLHRLVAVCSGQGTKTAKLSSGNLTYITSVTYVMS